MKFRVPQFWHLYLDKHTVFTVGVIKICALSFCGLHSPGCINLKTFCGRLQEEALMIPKDHPPHPQLKKFTWFWARLWYFQKSNVLALFLSIFKYLKYWKYQILKILKVWKVLAVLALQVWQFSSLIIYLLTM